MRFWSRIGAHLEPMPSADAPALRYCLSLQGAWSGRLSFELTDALALKAAGPAARVQAWSLAQLVRLTGPVTMSTSLARAPGSPGSQFEHTTRIHRLGALLFESQEVLTLEENGLQFRMVGTQRSGLGRVAPTRVPARSTRVPPRPGTRFPGWVWS